MRLQVASTLFRASLEGNFVFHSRFSHRSANVMANVWRLMAFNEPVYRPQMIRWAIDNCRIAIGWSEVQDLCQYGAPEDIQNQVGAIFGGPNDPGGAPTAGIQLWNFRGGAHRFYAGVGIGPHPHFLAMQCGDLVILKGNSFPASVVMRIQSPYQYVLHVPINQPPYGYQHQRAAVPTGCNSQNLWEEAGGLPGVQASGQSIFNALILMPRQVGCQAVANPR